ncbi:myxalamid-type polyketide synthase MxaF [Micromonospora pallida]|uniref:Myxalamid-type polyketide synthase MxaF n=1 Tax=Micromonospora pallida TaxID=145854 RepID=A0A1C6S1Q1_9ACTN|nr:type I polyketide synthase [Micromonospora pallida]SCL23201.1 myxalamid-type polyketide synthase MxaF [Micromonospora pallida]
MQHPDQAASRHDSPTAPTVEEWLRQHLAVQLGLDAAGLDAHERFHRYGLTSLRAAGLIAGLSQFLGRPLPATLVWDHPTIDSLVRFLSAGDRAPSVPDARPAVRESEPIAIIGMACRFPGARNTDAYWQLLTEGVDAITEVPTDRWDVDHFYSSAPDAPGRTSTRWGGFLDQVDHFDAGFFGLAPREVIQMDPQQRLFLELAWEALEDAGIAPGSLKDSPTGVFCGAMWQDYARLAARDPEDVTAHTATGHDLSVIPARVSYLLGLQGPSLAVNTACSSSLVAVHLACQSLRSGESTVALAGGVNLTIAPDSTVAMSKFGAMAPDGRSKAFDARANGYVRGEGAGIVVLKPLSRALADGDPVHCVIRGSTVNNDGFSNGLTAPNPQAQVAMLQAAYQRAGVAPERVHYVETHGTGTFLGDPIEANAIGAVLGANRPADRPLVIGSVKTNIGHLEAAAGIAGLIKTALAIRHQTVPPNLHFTQPNPHIDFERLRLRVPGTVESWPSPEEKPLAGVSAFGFGGTNCHVVLEGATPQPVHLLPLSAPDPAALRVAARAVREAATGPVALADLGYTAARQRTDQPYRLALPARTRDELVDRLDQWLAPTSEPVPAPSSPPRVVFVFPGQGGQWWGMGRELARCEPVFRGVLRECGAAFSEFVDWSLVEVLEGESVPEGIDVVQPVLFAVEVGLAALWRSWGVEPAAVVGHSMGEVAAAYVAGALSLSDAARVICERSGLLRRISGRGAMAVVELPAGEVEAVVAPFGGAVVVAALNGPVTTVVAGSSEAVDAVVASLSGRGVFARRVQVDVASHSPQVDELRDELVARLVPVSPRRAVVPLYSTVRGEVLAGTELDAGYWWENLREPVRFAPMVDRLLGDGSTCFLEISPHPVLGAAIEQSQARHPGRGMTLASTRRDEDERAALLDTAARLYQLGQPIHWPALYPQDVVPVAWPSASDTPADPARPTSQTAPGTASDVPMVASNDPAPASAMPGGAGGAPGGRDTGDAVLLPLSAHTPAALTDLTRRTVDLLRRHPNLDLRDLAHTAAVRRTHHGVRLAVAATSRADLLTQLEAHLADGRPSDPVPAGPARRVVFVFPGQGGQWWGMGRELARCEPVFRGVLRECGAAFSEFVDWSLVEVLEGESVPEGIDVVQPVLFAVEVGLAALWRSWGVEPAAVVGHSMGEVAAAYVAGALSLSDAARVICERSGLLRRISGRGAMAVVELPAGEVEAVVAPFGGAVVVAALNGPVTTVVAGSSEAVDAVVASLSGRGVFARRVQVDVASHSPQVDELRDELVARLVPVSPRRAVVPLYSTVRGEVLAGTELDAGYWWENLREPVRFAPMVDRLLGDGSTCFLEISPHPVLAAGIEQSCRARGGDGVVLASTRRDNPERLAMLDTAGELYRRGVPVDWTALHPTPGAVVRLPDYPWQRERFWADEPATAPARARRTGGHPLLGEHVESSLGAHLWTTEIDVDALPYLADHRVRGQVVVPATAYVEMALAAVGELLGTPARTVEQLDVVAPLAPSGERPTTVQVTLTGNPSGQLAFQCASRQPDENGQPGDWQVHARGSVRAGESAVAPDLADTPGTDGPELTGDEHYAAMRNRGLDYGPRFQGVRQMWRADGAASARIHLAEEPAGGYRVHPALLDSCLQVAIAALPGAADDTWVPVRIERLDLRERPGSTLSCRARLRPADASDPEARTVDLVVRADDGRVLLVVDGLRLRRLARDAADAGLLHEIRWEPLATPPGDADWAGRWLLLADRDTTLDAALAARGGTCVVVRPGPTYRRLAADRYELDPTRPEQFSDLLADAFGADRPCRGVIHRWALDAGDPKPDPTALEDAHRLVADSVLNLVRALHDLPPAQRPRLWLVTRDSQPAVPGDRVSAPLQAPLWGLGRTIAHEHPDLRCTRVDLGTDLPDEDAALLTALLVPAEEPDLALRGGDLLVSRLVAGAPGAATAVAEPAGDRPFRLELDRAGTLDQLHLRPFTPAPPGPGEVLIEVRASGLNFRDVLKTLGAYPGLDDAAVTLGDECAGVVAAVGPDVTDLRIGDPVVAVGRRCIGSHVRADARLVAPKPAGLDFADAATIPIAFLTAAYALEHLARIEPGERVLVHAAAGGVGLAAVQLAQAAGAEVFATAGSAEKRAYLTSLGVPHVLDSRSTAFAEQARAATGGQGVDVVLNSLAGEFITHGIAALAPYGRFVEIGKRDIHQDRPIGLGEFRRNLSFFAVDLDRMFTERTVLLGTLLRRIVARVDAGELRPLPTHRFPVAEVRDAFHLMEQAGHIGKIVLTVTDRQTVPVTPAPGAARIRPDASYLITGGFGGLGLGVARWLADSGARQLVLVGRTGAPDTARPVLDDLARAGVEVVALAADLTVADEVARVLGHVREHLAPLRGVVHAAGVLDDGILLQQTAERYRRVARPKVDAAWHLHDQTRTETLDFFVLFSSVTSVLGSPGQGGYAAGNAFLDALAHTRRAAGLPALSVNWGPWSAVGMAARLEQGGQEALRGLRAISPDQGVTVLGGLLGRDTAQVAVMPFDAAEWVAAYPAAARSNQLAHLGADAVGQPAAAGARADFLAAEPGRRRRAAMETYVRQEASRVLRLAPARIGVGTPLRSLGFDSLMSLELRNRLEAGLGIALSSTVIWNYPTIAVLVPYLAERMAIPLDPPTAPDGPDDADPGPAGGRGGISVDDPLGDLSVDDDLGDLSVDDLAALLVQELNDLDS